MDNDESKGQTKDEIREMQTLTRNGTKQAMT